MAFVHQHQAAVIDGGMSGAQPGAQAREQAARGEQQGLAVMTGGRQDEFIGKAGRWFEPGARIGLFATGTGDEQAYGPGLYSARPAAGKARTSPRLRMPSPASSSRAAAGQAGLLSSTASGSRSRACRQSLPATGPWPQTANQWAAKGSGGAGDMGDRPSSSRPFMHLLLDSGHAAEKAQAGADLEQRTALGGARLMRGVKQPAQQAISASNAVSRSGWRGCRRKAGTMACPAAATAWSAFTLGAGGVIGEQDACARARVEHGHRQFGIELRAGEHLQGQGGDEDREPQHGASVHEAEVACAVRILCLGRRIACVGAIPFSSSQHS